MDHGKKLVECNMEELLKQRDQLIKLYLDKVSKPTHYYRTLKAIDGCIEKLQK